MYSDQSPRAREFGDTADGPRVLVISGSIREPSYTRTLAEQIGAALVSAGASALLWSLSERPLPVADPRFHDDPGMHSNDEARALAECATEADAFVLCTPIYHNSYSGVLKNALDHLSIPHFRYKPVGLCSHGGNRSTQAVDQLRIVVRGLAGVAIPSQVCSAAQDYGDAASGAYELTSRLIVTRIAKFALELTLFAACLRPARSWAMGIPPAQGTDGVRDAGPRAGKDELVQLRSSG
jgi:azobenzene reductase